LTHTDVAPSTRRFLATLPLVAFALSQGCANLAAIRDFGTISAESASYKRLIEDYVAEPEREKRFTPKSHHEDLNRQRVERAAQEERLLLRQTAIVAYMDALAQLAADDVVVYDKEIDGLASALKANKFAGEQDADAFAAIAKLLAKAATDAWRQRKLKELIYDSNKPIQDLIAALRKVVELGIARDDAENESEAARKYYKKLQHSSKDPAGIAALAEWWEYRQAEIDARQHAARTYVEVLNKISAGHQKLYDERDQLRNDDTTRQIKAYVRDLRALYKTLRKD
jgi:hypothetical protein